MNKHKGSKFKNGQHIFCTGGLHQGQTATIVKANNQRLTVKFDNPTHVGMFVDISDAIIVANNFDPMKDTDPRIKTTTKVAPNPGYYAVAKGRNTGVYNNWEQCNNQVNGYPDSKFKKFNNLVDDVNFVETHNDNQSTINAKGAKMIHNDTELNVLPLLLCQLAMTTATTINQTCNDEHHIQHTQESFFKEVKKYLHPSADKDS